MPNIVDVFPRLIESKQSQFSADLIQRLLPHWPFETTLLVNKSMGEPDGRSFVDDEGHKFYNIVWPKNADSAPEWGDDKGINYDPWKYAAYLGSTGLGRTGSFLVGYDIDILGTHKGGTSVSGQRCADIEAASKGLSYLEIRRSSGGQGRHAYVWLANVPASNHVEHKAVARAVLAKWYHDAGLNPADALADLDRLGGNMWLWCHSASDAKRSYECLQPASVILTEADIPTWRDNLDVVARRRKSVRVAGLPDSHEDAFAELCSAFVPVKQDDVHKVIFAKVQELGYPVIHNAERGVYVTHSVGLKKAHDALGLRGVFDTTSGGRNPSDPNCFVSLRADGGLYVVRFSDSQEGPTWHKTTNGWPACTYNMPVSFRMACDSVAGAWMGDSFSCSVASLPKLSKLLDVAIPPLPSERPVTVKQWRGGLLLEAQRVGQENVEGWGVHSARKLRLCLAPTLEDDAKTAKHDNKVRHLTTQSDTHNDAGWVVLDDAENWTFEPTSHAQKVLMQCGLTRTESDVAMGALIRSPWRLVNEPMADEFLPNRRWNLYGAQLAYVPGTPGNHNSWSRVFDHLGRGLDDAVKANDWCVEHGVTNGSQFLTLWAAMLIRHPKQSLPLLFFHSQLNNTGKSTFHRCLELLLARGCANAKHAISEQFNLSIAGAVLCYLEEDRVPPGQFGKLKQLVDSDWAMIRPMRVNPYRFENYTHWVVSSNYHDAIPIESGDKRVVMIGVDPLEDEIPWPTFREVLRNEAASFLASIYQVEIPPAEGRLHLPVLATALKQQVTQADDEPVAPLSDTDTELVEAIDDALLLHDALDGSSEELRAIIRQCGSDPGPYVRAALNRVSAMLREHSIEVDFSRQRALAIRWSNTIYRTARSAA